MRALLDSQKELIHEFVKRTKVSILINTGYQVTVVLPKGLSINPKDFRLVCNRSLEMCYCQDNIFVIRRIK